MDKAQEQLRNVCKHAARMSMTNAKNVSYLEDEQVEQLANVAYMTANYNKLDEETFLKAWKAAYKKAQEMLIHVDRRFASGNISSSPQQTVMQLKISDDYRCEPSQILQSMKWAEEYEGGWDIAYQLIAEKVEAAAIPEQSEVAV